MMNYVSISLFGDTFWLRKVIKHLQANMFCYCHTITNPSLWALKGDKPKRNVTENITFLEWYDRPTISKSCVFPHLPVKQHINNKPFWGTGQIFTVVFYFKYCLWLINWSGDELNMAVCPYFVQFVYAELYQMHISLNKCSR